MKEYKSARNLYSKQQLLLPSTPWPGAIALPFAVAFVNRCRAKQVRLGAALAFDVINRLAPQHQQRNQLDAERQQLYERIYEQQKKSSTSTSTTTTKQRKVQQIEVKIIINNAPAAATPTASTASAATPAGAAADKLLRQVSGRFFKVGCMQVLLCIDKDNDS